MTNFENTDGSGPLTVLHVVSSLNIGGAERFVLDLCRKQRASGLLPEILSFGSQDDALVESCKTSNIPLIFVNKTFWERQAKLFKELKNHKLIHIHSPSALRASALAIKILNLKGIVYTRHGAAPLNKRRWRTAHRLIRDNIAIITFVSREGLENFLSTYNWHQKQTKVISNGIDTEELARNVGEVENNLELVRLGMVGRLVPTKRHIMLLQAIDRLSNVQKGKVELHLFGVGECREELEKFSSRVLDSTRIVFHGNVTNRIAMYRSFDVLVSTSETEGLPLSVIEAMSAGRPAIATMVGDTGLLVKDSTGWPFEYGDVDQLVKYLRAVIDSPELIHEKGRRAQEHVVREFGMDRVLGEYMQAYSIALNQPIEI